MTREEVSPDYHPEGWRVYVIQEPRLGFFAGMKPHWQHVPLWTDTLEGAWKFDAFRDLSARVKAMTIRDYYAPNGTVYAYKRHDIFPEEYMGAAKRGLNA